MATTPGSRRDPRSDTPSSLDPMQEPLGSTERPIPRTSDDNDVNISGSSTGRTSSNLGTTGAIDRDNRGGGFTTTFAIIAAVLVAAFLIALYMGSDRTNTANAPGTQPPVAETTPGTGAGGNDATGSTTPVAPSQEAPPASGNSGTANETGTGTGTTAPANP